MYSYLDKKKGLIDPDLLFIRNIYIPHRSCPSPPSPPHPTQEFSEASSFFQVSSWQPKNSVFKIIDFEKGFLKIDIFGTI